MNRTQRLIEKIKATGVDVPADARIRRTHAGRHQKAAGAWSAIIVSDAEPLFMVGIFIPVAELVRCPSLTVQHEHGSMVADCGCRGECRKGDYHDQA